MPTEADWKARTAERVAKMAPQRTINEAYLRQAAVSAELLTNHPGWDVYLQSLQVDLDEAEQALAHWKDQITSYYSEDTLRMVQMQVAIMKDRVQTLTRCMSLPKDIIAHAKEQSTT